MKKFLVAACAGILSISGAMAQNAMPGSSSSLPISNPTGVLPDFNPETLLPILEELGAGTQVFQGGEAGTYIGVDAGGGMRFILEPRACSAETKHCTGLKIYTLMQGYADPATVADFNKNAFFTKTMIDPDAKQAVIFRYEIAEFGMARGNFYVSLLVFIGDTVSFSNELATAAQTVSYDGAPAANMSTAQLNMMASAKLSGLPLLQEGVVIDQHKIGTGFDLSLIESIKTNETFLEKKIKNVTAD